jgi:hypothetical protein
MHKTIARLAMAGTMAMLVAPAFGHEVGAWAGASAAPAERSEVAVAEFEGKAYVIGDYNGATDLLIYDMASDHWSVGAPFPYPVHHTAAAVYKGIVYVFGGYINGWEASSNVWAYIPEKDIWEPRASIPTPRGRCCCCGHRWQDPCDQRQFHRAAAIPRRTKSTIRSTTAGPPLPPCPPRAITSRWWRSMVSSWSWAAASMAIPAAISTSTRSTTRPPTAGAKARPSPRPAAALPPPRSMAKSMSWAGRAIQKCSTRSRPMASNPTAGTPTRPSPRPPRLRRRGVRQQDLHHDRQPRCRRREVGSGRGLYAGGIAFNPR